MERRCDFVESVLIISSDGVAKGRTKYREREILTMQRETRKKLKKDIAMFMIVTGTEHERSKSLLCSSSTPNVRYVPFQGRFRADFSFVHKKTS